ncbi:uncharacterized protein N7518_007199 [Penicillium psychrosexuale]|uniref:uncharacterized protein n=1 Tax=Penicillium psychrosexuale TaxID=1002107 RepID=UPI002545186D|nr:uncharacterized protein N7518_007199 [Penicillium psychrosexuale]KAJ5790188.1 hypothetical protein N7518_007199 [Penicillium psychrosexuale]
MRGAGEKPFESDLPPGEGMVTQINEAPNGRERFEMELYHRLRIWENGTLRLSVREVISLWHFLSIQLAPWSVGGLALPAV